MTEGLNAEEIIQNTSIRLTERDDRSLQTWFLHMILRLAGNHVGRPGKTYPVGSAQLKPPSSTRKMCNVNQRRVEDVWMYDLTLKYERSKVKKKEKGKTVHRIYYWAGGGWQSPPGTSHWRFLTALLNELPQATITLISYPLAPNSPAPTAFPHLLRLYNAIMKESAEKGEIVTLGGDSSGGEIVLCIPLEALRQNIYAPKPHSIMAICPSVDLSRENPAIKEIQKHDPILKVRFINETASRWAGSWDRKDPRISPIYSEQLSLFQRANIKVDGITAGYDLLGPDGILMRNKLAKNKVEGEWLHWEKMMHCWPLVKTYGISPESEEAFQWMVNVLRRRVEEQISDVATAGEGNARKDKAKDDFGQGENV
ncbi:uncharacterized protein PV09_02276 [Verruconis gallopava]|uniref:Alpha/beta hydrolase fold-3 domain-containing protein n=1 Tax=Verruconis gallopava TaxID=253628 RepID=A0A0D1XXE2_9PEZI|nr:uncharacterized protein PV09_02276 [Verruconis gallopava]KIW07436.1 hypothetical protein PV09_02276 [Verruconis gallopava]